MDRYENVAEETDQGVQVNKATNVLTLDEIANLRAAIDRQFGNAVKQPPASDPPPARRRQQLLQFVAAKPPIDDGNEGSHE